MNPDVRLYQDTIYLVKTFNTNPGFKAAFLDSLEKPRVTFRGRPLKLYTRLIASTDRQYLPFTRGHQSSENIENLFEHFYKNTLAFRKLEQKAIAGVNFLPAEEHQELERIDKLPNGEQKVKTFEAFVQEKESAPAESFGETKEEKDDDKKKKGLIQILRGRGGGFNLNLPTKWLKNIGSKTLQLGKQLIQGVIRGAGRILGQMIPKLGNFAVNAGSRILAQLTGTSLAGFGVTVFSAFIWAAGITIGVFFLAALWTTFFGFAAPNKPIDYTLPIRNSNIVPTDTKAQEIKDIIIQKWPNAQINNWNLIIKEAKNNGWNPALLLTLWIVASGAQGQTDYLDPLGCKPSQPPNQDINQSLTCFFKEFENNRFDVHALNFLRQWTNGFDPQNQNPGLINDIKYWYSLMIPSGEGAITPNKPSVLDYKIPFRDNKVNVSPANVDIVTSKIKIDWPNAKLANWNTIVSQSIAAEWNPAFVLALWMEESHAQGFVDAQGNPKYSDPLGCDPQQPTDNIDISLKCLFDNFSKYPNDQFQQFMEKYSSGPLGDPFGNNPNFPSVIKSLYATLIPAGSYGAIEPVINPPTGNSGISGCPVIGTITNPYGYNLPDYPYKNVGCIFNNCHNGIDIDAAIGTEIRSPMKGFTYRGKSELKGQYLEIHENPQAFTTEMIITFNHLSEYAPKFAVGQGNEVTRGEVIGKTGDSGESTGPHLHYQINMGTQPQNPLFYLNESGSATIDQDIKTKLGLKISDNNYAEIRHQPGSITNNWGFCNTLPSP